MSKEDIIRSIEAEISKLQEEIENWKVVLSQLRGMESKTKAGSKTVTAVQPRRGRSTTSTTRKAKRGPGRPPLSTSKRKTPSRRSKYDIPVSEMIAGILNTMKQPALITDLTTNVHKKYPTLGGVKYRAMVSSMVSRNKRFERVGKDKVKLRKGY